MSSEDAPLDVQTSAPSNPKRPRNNNNNSRSGSPSKHARTEGDSDVTARKTNESVKAEEQKSATTFEPVSAIYNKMQKLQRSQQNDQSNKNGNNSNTSGTSSSSSPSSSSSSRQNWDRLHEIFSDLENKLAEDNKPDSFNADKFSVSAITSSSPVSRSASEKQFCFPRVFLSLGLWAQQQQSAVSGDSNTGVVLPPCTADGLEAILRAKCLWLRTDLRDAHGALMFRYWADDSFNDFIKKTIFPKIFKSLFVKFTFTISEFAKRETFREGSPSHETKGICNKFTNVLFPLKKEHESLVDRNIGFQGKLVEINEPLDARKVCIFCGSSGSGKTIGALSAAKCDNADNVVFFLSAGDPCFNALQDREVTSKKTRDETTLNELSKRIEQHVGDKCILQKEENKLSVNPFNIVIIIDEIGARPLLLRGLISQVTKISIRLHNFFFEDQIDAGTFQVKSRIRIIAAGTGASYLHSAPGSKDDYKTFIFDTEQESNPEKYNYYQEILKATEFLKDKIKNEAVHELLMRLDGEHQRDLCRRKEAVYESRLSEVKRERKQASAGSSAKAPSEKSAESTVDGWPTQVEIETGHLLRNARCAALAVQYLQTWIDEHFRNTTVMPSVSAMNERLTSVVYQVVRKYASMNGLSKYRTTPKEDILKLALAVSLHRLPYLPDATILNVSEKSDEDDDNDDEQDVPPETISQDNASNKEKDSNDTSKSSDAELDKNNTTETFSVANASHDLITVGGVLLDVCESSDATLLSTNKISLGPFLPRRQSSSSTSAQPASKQSPSVQVTKRMTPCVTRMYNFCRYYFSHAHLVMLRSFAGMPLARPLDFSYSFEQNVAEFCGLTAMSSRARVELEQCIDPDLLKSYNENVNKKHDSLFGLKQLLSFGRTIDGVEILQLTDSPLRTMFRMCYMDSAADAEKQMWDLLKKDDLFDSARAKMTILKDKIVSALKAGQAVVIVSREMESFADIIVVGPDRVLLIQCKQKNQAADAYAVKNKDGKFQVTFSSKTNVLDELDKMGVRYVYSQSKGTKFGLHAMHELRVEYVKMLEEAAKEGDTRTSEEKNKVEKVGKEQTTLDGTKAIFIVELGSSPESINAEPRDFLSHSCPDFGKVPGARVECAGFVVSRTGIGSDRLTGSSFFPVPHTCEAVTDNCKYTTVADAKRRMQTADV